MTADAIGLTLFAVGLFGLVGYVVLAMARTLRAERSRQEPQRRSSLALVVVVAVLVYGIAAALTDYRQAVTVTLIAMAIVVVANRAPAKTP